MHEQNRLSNDVECNKIQQHVDPEQISNFQLLSINDIDKIPKDTDDLQKIEVKLTLPYFLLKEINNSIKKRFGESRPTLNGYFERKCMEWNKENELLDHVGSLSFGSSSPRKDVLLRLHQISLEFETYPEFPRFKRNHVEAILKKVIGYKDPRTFKKYFDCIKNFVESKIGKSIIYYGDYDLTDFKEIIQKALSKDEINQNKREYN